MMDKIPSPINIPPQEIKLSTQSTIFNITSEKQYRRKVNKVDEFLSKWENSKSKIKTKEKEQKISKPGQQNKPIRSRLLKYLTID